MTLQRWHRQLANAKYTNAEVRGVVAENFNTREKHAHRRWNVSSCASVHKQSQQQKVEETLDKSRNIKGGVFEKIASKTVTFETKPRQKS